MESHDRKPKKKTMKIEDMTKEQIRQAILKKRECNAKAQKIVESLLETGISREYLLQCLPDINQSHYDDITEERSIIRLCGYPTCDQRLSDDIPKQKYRISLKSNKVYDITARKNFCTNICYKAAMHVKNQLLTSPLWFREYEEIPVFNLLPKDARGSMGQEVDLGVVDKTIVKPVQFTSINDFAHASLNEIHNDSDENVQNDDKLKEDTSTLEAIDKPVNEKENLSKVIVEKPVTKPSNLANKIVGKKDNVPTKTTTVNPLNIVGEIIEKPEKKIDPILLSMPESNINKESDKPKKLLNRKQPVVTALAIHVERCLAEWFTLDTLLFLCGEEKVREMLQEKGECIKEYFNNYAKGVFYNSNTYDQYQELCKKLNILELEDRKNDSQTFQRDMKPLPDYSIVKEDSKRMELKVKAYLSGEMTIPEPEQNEEEISQDDENYTQLPLVDKNSQNALRRRIVCQHLNKILPDLLRSLGLLPLSMSSQVRLLVNTLKLKADNIMFKPIQWTLIAIIFIKLLSLKDKKLECMLEQPVAYEHMQLLLLSYKQDGGYLDRLISWLTDIDRLLDTNDTQLTVE